MPTAAQWKAINDPLRAEIARLEMAISKLKIPIDAISSEAALDLESRVAALEQTATGGANGY